MTINMRAEERRDPKPEDVKRRIDALTGANSHGANPALVTSAQIRTALDEGGVVSVLLRKLFDSHDESHRQRIRVWVMKCVEYDVDFAKRLRGLAAAEQIPRQSTSSNTIPSNRTRRNHAAAANVSGRRVTLVRR